MLLDKAKPSSRTLPKWLAPRSKGITTEGPIDRITSQTGLRNLRVLSHRGDAMRHRLFTTAKNYYYYYDHRWGREDAHKWFKSEDYTQDVHKRFSCLSYHRTRCSQLQ